MTTEATAVSRPSILRLFALREEVRRVAEGEIPEAWAKKRPVSMEVMEHPFVEKWLARAHPITPGIWFGPIIIAALYLGFSGYPGPLMTLAWFGAGILITTFIEYTLHRFVFHAKPTTQNGRLRHFLLHGYHHEFPNDTMRLVLPPLGIWPFAALMGVLYYFAFGSVWMQVYAGSAIGYVAYDWVHYYTHHFNPKTGVGKWIKRYHMLHHHDSEYMRYGITSPLWDFVFGTYLPINKMARAQKTPAATQ